MLRRGRSVRGVDENGSAAARTSRHGSSGAAHSESPSQSASGPWTYHVRPRSSRARLLTSPGIVVSRADARSIRRNPGSTSWRRPTRASQTADADRLGVTNGL